MLQFIVIAAVSAAASAMPRFLVVPLEDVQFLGDPRLDITAERHRRAVIDDESAYPPIRNLPPLQQLASRRQDFGPGGPGFPSPGAATAAAPHDRGAPPGSFLSALQGANIPIAADNLAAESGSYRSPPKGPDYVDYGAYTGKHGAFGWYSDHPVLLFKHH